VDFDFLGVSLLKLARLLSPHAHSSGPGCTELRLASVPAMLRGLVAHAREKLGPLTILYSRKRKITFRLLLDK